MSRSLLVCLLVCIACSPAQENTDTQESPTAGSSEELAESPSEEVNLLEEGKAALREKDGAKARQLLQRCTEANKEATECWWELGWAYWLLEDWQSTRQCWEKVRVQNPERESLNKWLSAARVRAAAVTLKTSLRCEGCECTAANGSSVRTTTFYEEEIYPPYYYSVAGVVEQSTGDTLVVRFSGCMKYVFGGVMQIDCQTRQGGLRYIEEETAEMPDAEPIIRAAAKKFCAGR